jgi:FkbM family methyltransferase
VQAREANALTGLLQAHQGRCVVYGAGTLGLRAIELLRASGTKPLAVCDSNPQRWGQLLAGLTVLSPPQAAEAFGKHAVFFVTVWNDFHWFVETEAKLRALGCVSISTYAPLFWRFGSSFMQTLLLLNEPPHRLYLQMQEVLKAETLWADTESLDTYRANIRWRALGDPRQLPFPAPQTTYFPPDLLQPTTNEVFVDCGAFDGDTLRQMLAWNSGQFSAAYPIEADTVSLAKLKACIATLRADVQQKIHPLACAVGAERCTLRFAMSGTLTATTANGTGDGVDIDCRTLDELFTEASPDRPITMIKMDIEGAEYGALLGAKTIIERDSPVLAICVYHTQSDVWRVPLLLHTMRTDYSFFLRSYDGDGLQTVLYAVPPHRLLSAEQRSHILVPRKSVPA